MSRSGEQVRNWWHKSRVLSRAEKVADAIVHGTGLVVALVAGSALLTFALLKSSPEHFAPLLVYVVTLVGVLSVSMAFNLWPRTPVKKWLARLDQAAIFLFIAGTYTPILSLARETPLAHELTLFVWAMALIGVALKLIVPHKFGRLAIPLYLAIGWSGVVVFKDLALNLPPSAFWLLLAGGLTYSVGILFHLSERLKFYSALWHTAVVLGASLHLFAIFDLVMTGPLAG